MVIGIVVVVMLGIQVYVKRGLQARFKTTMDGAVTAIGAPTQYEPYYASSKYERTADSEVTLTYAPRGAITQRERNVTLEEPTKDASGNPLPSRTTEFDVTADDTWR